MADHFRGTDRPFHLIFGLLANKDAPGVLHPFRGRALTVHTIPVPDHEHHAPAELAAVARDAGMTAMTAAGSRTRSAGSPATPTATGRRSC